MKKGVVKVAGWLPETSKVPKTLKEAKNMKRYMWIIPVVTLTVVAFFTASRRFDAASVDDQNGGDRTVAPLDGTINTPTRGVVFKTAAINSVATVANCFRCNRANTFTLGTGLYQVGFDENVQANNGWSRWVQVDTLSTGSISNVSCTTADRAGVPSAVWVACFNNATGLPANTSFFLFVAR